jgi:outer membrane protein assembly factor BamB
MVIPSNFGLKNPCGIEVSDDRLFVSDYNTGEILCFDINTNTLKAKINTGKPGIIGLKIDKNKRLWYVNALTNEVYRVDPK